MSNLTPDEGTSTPTRSDSNAAAHSRPDAVAVALLIGRARSLAAIAGFALGSYLSLRFGHPGTEALVRGLASGGASALAVWALGVALAAWLRSAALAPASEHGRKPPDPPSLGRP